MPFNKEEDIKIKYAYVDGEASPKYKKKSKKKPPKKADHKHEYQNIIIEYLYPNNYPISSFAGKPAKAIESYCPICGKMDSAKEDPVAKKLFPHICTGHFGFIARIIGYEEESEDYKEWASKHYPHYFMSDYLESSYRGQVFLDLDKIIPAEA